MSEPFSAAPGVSAFTPSLIGGTGTTTKIFPSLLGSGFGTGANALTSQASKTLPTVPTPVGAAAASVLIRGTGEYEQQVISITAGGFVFVHGTTPTVNFVLQQGTSLTAASNTTVATLASVQTLTTNATYPWALKLSAQADAISGIMQFFAATISCNGVSGTVTLTDLTGVNLTTTGLSFVLGVTFGVSDGANVAGLSCFNLTAA
jgi:hypothetical protein